MSVAETESVLALLKGARAARSDPASAERAVLAALRLAPDDLTARLAAYKFYFYNHRLAEARAQAADLLSLIARRLNIAGDWREAKPTDAAFAEIDGPASLYVQTLIAWGYAQARLGRRDEGRAAIAKAAEIDPRDRFGARRLIAVIDRGGEPEEE